MSIEHDVQPVHAKNKKSKTESTYDENVGEVDIDSTFQFFFALALLKMQLCNASPS